MMAKSSANEFLDCRKYIKDKIYHHQ